MTPLQDVHFVLTYNSRQWPRYNLEPRFRCGESKTIYAIHSDERGEPSESMIPGALAGIAALYRGDITMALGACYA